MAYIPFVMTPAIMRAVSTRDPNARIVFERKAVVFNGMRRRPSFLEAMKNLAALDAVVHLDQPGADWRNARMGGRSMDVA